MKYIAVDVETTGLNNRVNEMIEVAMVYDDLCNQIPIEALPRLHLWIDHASLTLDKSAYIALKDMYNNYLEMWANPDKRNGMWCESNKVASEVYNFLYSLDPANVRWNIAGKNPTFDIGFLSQYSQINYHYRLLDPAVLYLDPKVDDVIPNLTKCLGRANVDGGTLHSAVDDALAIVKLLRHKFPM